MRAVSASILRSTAQNLLSVLHQGPKLPAVRTDSIGSALWEQVISSPMRTIVAKLITASR